jgi:hypothetical protein
MSAIAQTLTRPAGENKLALELTLDSGVIHHYEIAADPFYKALKEILVAATPTHVVVEPVAHPSTFAEIASPS